MITEYWNFFIACLFSACVMGGGEEPPQPDMIVVDANGVPIIYEDLRNVNIPLSVRLGPKNPRQTVSGSYLTSRFAQNRHDWKTAAEALSSALGEGEADPALIYQLKNRLMVLNMGAGRYEEALVIAHELHEADDPETEPYKSLAALFVCVEAIKIGDYERAQEILREVDSQGLYAFVSPLLQSWTAAALGELNVSQLEENNIHIRHAIIIADFLDEREALPGLLQRASKVQQVHFKDLELIADAYTSIGEHENALILYENIYSLMPQNRLIGNKIETLRNDPTHNFLIGIESLEAGIAQSLYNMAEILVQTQNMESARVFAHAALYLYEEEDKARVMLSQILANEGQHEAAVRYLRNVQPQSAYYLDAQRIAADLLNKSGQTQEAIDKLDGLYRLHNDLEAFIMIGDIYRTQDEFGRAAEVYSQAINLLGGEVPPQYWQLYYVLGISYEQMGDWEKAERDLKRALDFHPNNAVILNYLAYTWADKGVHLDKALEMLEKAVSLKPGDGYIVDSLGWVLYRLGRYEEALPHLERAVALVPYDPIINDHLGDVYWKLGRRMEAQFQWTRAVNHSEDSELTEAIQAKIEDGLPQQTIVIEEARLKDGNTIKQ